MGILSDDPCEKSVIGSGNLNIQQPTSNIEHPVQLNPAVSLDVGCSMLDVGCCRQEFSLKDRLPDLRLRVNSIPANRA